MGRPRRKSDDDDRPPQQQTHEDDSGDDHMDDSMESSSSCPPSYLRRGVLGGGSSPMSVDDFPVEGGKGSMSKSKKSPVGTTASIETTETESETSSEGSSESCSSTPPSPGGRLGGHRHPHAPHAWIRTSRTFDDGLAVPSSSTDDLNGAGESTRMEHRSPTTTMGLRHRDHHAALAQLQSSPHSCPGDLWDDVDIDDDGNDDGGDAVQYHPGRRKPSKPYLVLDDSDLALIKDDDQCGDEERGGGRLWSSHVPLGSESWDEEATHHRLLASEERDKYKRRRGTGRRHLVVRRCLPVVLTVAILSAAQFGMLHPVLRDLVDVRGSLPYARNPPFVPIAFPDDDARRILAEQRRTVLERIRQTTQHLLLTGGGNTFTLRLAAPTGETSGLSRRRADVVRTALDAHAHCPSVGAVHVEWDEAKDGAAAPPSGIADHPSGKVRLVGRGVGAAPPWGRDGGPTANTDAVLLLAEDVAFTCDELDRAFEVWSRNPDRMVGFFPYLHRIVEEEQRPTWPVSFNPSASGSSAPWKAQEVPRGRGPYSLVSDRAAFVHRLYLQSRLPSAGPGGACDAFRVSLGVTSLSLKPPLAIAADPVEVLSSPMMHRMRSVERERITEGSAWCLTGMMANLDLVDLPTEEVTFLGRR